MSVLPFLVVGLILAVILSGSLNSIALGDDLASLPRHESRPHPAYSGIIAVTLLAGGATALTSAGSGSWGSWCRISCAGSSAQTNGGSSFTPHSAAPTLVLAADVLGRVVARPGEIEVGIVTAVIGAPVLRSPWYAAGKRAGCAR